MLSVLKGQMNKAIVHLEELFVDIEKFFNAEKIDFSNEGLQLLENFFKAASSHWDEEMENEIKNIFQMYSSPKMMDAVYRSAAYTSLHFKILMPELAALIKTKLGAKGLTDLIIDETENVLGSGLLRVTYKGVILFVYNARTNNAAFMYENALAETSKEIDELQREIAETQQLIESYIDDVALLKSLAEKEKKKGWFHNFTYPREVEREMKKLHHPFTFRKGQIDVSHHLRCVRRSIDEKKLTKENIDYRLVQLITKLELMKKIEDTYKQQEENLLKVIQL